MKVKTAMQYHACHLIDRSMLEHFTGVAWRFGFGLISPKAAGMVEGVSCECDNRFLLRDDCPWHGVAARRVCFPEDQAAQA